MTRSIHWIKTSYGPHSRRRGHGGHDRNCQNGCGSDDSKLNYNLMNPNHQEKLDDYNSKFDEGLVVQGTPMWFHANRGCETTWFPNKPSKSSCKQDVHVHFATDKNSDSCGNNYEKENKHSKQNQ